MDYIITEGPLKGKIYKNESPRWFKELIDMKRAREYKESKPLEKEEKKQKETKEFKKPVKTKAYASKNNSTTSTRAGKSK